MLCRELVDCLPHCAWKLLAQLSDHHVSLTLVLSKFAKIFADLVVEFLKMQKLHCAYQFRELA